LPPADYHRLQIVGLADRAVEESKDRVRSAIRNCEADFPARKIQKQRFKGKISTNSEMSNAEIREYCTVTSEGLELLKMAISSLNLSARGYHRVLKLARTIADLAESENILTEHIAEALQYRAKDES